ncbi:MAG: segregation/condensation protein A, partial [Micromonosporaceae bacterium]|nr:segregation/condensation protein A [Micromonosporaceae bacterium]
AFKEAAAYLSELSDSGGRRWPRAVGLEPRFAEALPELVLGIGPQRLAKLAARALSPKQPPVVSVEHLHLVRVSVREHAAALREKLLRLRAATFRALCADCQSTLEVVARFLAVLELYREGMVGFEQVQALGELTVRWTGPEDAVADWEIDEYAGAPAAEPAVDDGAAEDAAARPVAGEPEEANG